MKPKKCLFPFQVDIGVRRYFSFFIATLLLFQLKAQSEALSNKELQRELRLTNQLLQNTHEKRNATLEDYLVLETKVRSRRCLIHSLTKELQVTDEKIQALQLKLDSASTDLNMQKEKYAGLIRNAFHDRLSVSTLQFLLSSKSLNEAFSRLNYLKQVEKFRANQVVEITNQTIRLQQAQEDLELGISEKRAIVEAADKQSKYIETEQEALANLFNDLKAKEEQLSFELQEIKAANNNMSSQLHASISNSENDKPVRSLRKDFASLRGKLPWPVAEGVISQKYGVQDHPTLKNIKIQNNGVDIATAEQASVLAVYDGIVMAISDVAGFGKTIIVKHGDYYSVYSKLGSVNVQKGQTVQQKEVIGRVQLNKNYHTLHFEIWHRKERKNPMRWITSTNT